MQEIVNQEYKDNRDNQEYKDLITEKHSDQATRVFLLTLLSEKERLEDYPEDDDEPLAALETLLDYYLD